MEEKDRAIANDGTSGEVAEVEVFTRTLESRAIFVLVERELLDTLQLTVLVDFIGLKDVLNG